MTTTDTRDPIALKAEAVRMRLDGATSDDICRKLHKGREFVRDALRDISPPKHFQPRPFFQQPPAPMPDTRDKTGRLAGDPLPHRSALAQRGTAP